MRRTKGEGVGQFLLLIDQFKTKSEWPENFWCPPVGRIVPKTLRSPFCWQNVSFLVKIEGAEMKTNQRKTAKKKHRSSKNKVRK